MPVKGEEKWLKSEEEPIDGKAAVRSGESRSFGRSSPAGLKKAGKSLIKDQEK